jgi:DNA-binding GntR family transcriptional regulator
MKSATKLKFAPRVERRVLRDDIRDQLISDILNGRLAPGDRIVETRIAQKLGVSQAPVREALRDLELFGFIVSSPFRGAIVRRLGVEDLLQLYPIRAVLEGLAAREAVAHIRESDLKRLQKLIIKMRQTAARGDTRGNVDADFAFHKIIVDASGNWLLKQMWERLALATTTFLTVSKSNHTLSEIAERHVLVLEALRSGDPQTAEAAMRAHIDQPGDWLRTALDEGEREER